MVVSILIIENEFLKYENTRKPLASTPELKICLLCNFTMLMQQIVFLKFAIQRSVADSQTLCQQFFLLCTASSTNQALQKLFFVYCKHFFECRCSGPFCLSGKKMLRQIIGPYQRPLNNIDKILMILRNSRTLPGQSWLIKASNATGSSPRMSRRSSRP